MAADRNETARRVRNAIAWLLRGPRRIGWIDRALADSADFILDCRTVRRHLSDAHDEQLPPWKRRLLRAHVATCMTCGPVDESLRSTIAHLGGLRD